MKPQIPEAHSNGWISRIGWLILIWLASVFALGMLAGVFRLIMAAAGLTR